MRPGPSPLQPTDHSLKQYVPHRKQFQQLNQHYTSHNAVIPTRDLTEVVAIEGYTGKRPLQQRLDEPSLRLPPKHPNRNNIQMDSANYLRARNMDQLPSSNRVSSGNQSDARRMEMANIGLRAMQQPSNPTGDTPKSS
jgi:hypothetical protein